MTSAEEADWRALNRANWDERVGVHLGSRGYDLAPLRAGRGRLDPIVEAELGPVGGMRVLHLQCHFGKDTLTLAPRGAEVVGLDFSAPAIMAARALAEELGLQHRARFIEADLYDAPVAIAEPASFDRVFVTWGAICWLPDVSAWARVVAHFLRPGGVLYFAEGHPAALVLDDAAGLPDGKPGFHWPYLGRGRQVDNDPRDYADSEARLRNAVTHQWLHPLGDVVCELTAAGLRLEWLHEHDAVPWRMFGLQVRGADGLYRWPDHAWLPLSYSLMASRAAGAAGPPGPC